MRLRDLITDAGGQTLSHSKLWSNLACAAATFAFLRQAWVGSISAEIWWAYLGCVGGATVASKYLSLKWIIFQVVSLLPGLALGVFTTYKTVYP